LFIVNELTASATVNTAKVVEAPGLHSKLNAYMTLDQIARLRPRRGATLLVTAALISAAVSVPSAADPMSDTFQPDAFRTRSALRQLTPGLNDPFAHDCAMPKGSLSLAQAVEIALCRNPTTRTAWATAHQQAAALGSAESGWLPTITATDSQSGTFGKYVDVTGNVDTTPQYSNDAAVNLTWTVYDFGGRTGRIRSARYLLDAAAKTADSSVQQTVFSVVQSYFGVIAGNDALAAAKTAEDAAFRTVQIVRALQKGGAATLGDVLQAETAYDQAVLSSVQAAQTAKTSLGTLAITIGVNADSPIKLDAAEPVPTEVPALTARMSDLMAEAMRQRPDLAAAQAQVDSAVADITVARAAGRPSIALTGGHDRIDASGVPLQNYSQVGLQLTVPIFTGFSVGYSVRQSQAALEIRDVNAEQVRLSVSQSVWNGYYALDSANQQLAATGTLIATADKNQEVALGRYQAGVGTILDLLTAQTAAALAAQLRITAVLNWQVSRGQLVLALGRLYGAEPLATGTPLQLP
jgi:outer membrane protein